ncbi:MAG: TonB-dependent receptor plug domain-containing protein [Verrucomicrobiota bacterium]
MEAKDYMQLPRDFKSALVFLLAGAISLSAQESAEDDDVIVLEEFIIEETGAALNDTVMPTDREISGLFGETTSVLEVPRSVTLLSPEIMDKFNIDDLRDLEKIGAGTQAYNFYGIAGTPVIRGAEGGTFLNGMLRAYQRNEMPLSFGSLEAIEIVKGPAPADFSTTQIGGFVNLLPKSPFFDEERGSIELEFDNWGRQTITADYGSPFLLPGDIPAAYRVSLTAQDGESYYDDFNNDYTSVYGAIKFRPKDGISIFVGGEYFDFQSNENAGWNRPTQQLIDNDQYVIGEPALVLDPIYFGNANRLTVEFPFAWGIPALGALAVPGDIARAEISDALRGFMLDLNDAGDRAIAYDTTGLDFFGNPLPGEVVDALEANENFAQDSFVYTQEYFDNGGEVITQSIDGSDVLTDPSDFADSQDIVLFGDLIFDSNPDREYVFKGIAEYLETDKQSSYGYAIQTEQTVIGTKAFVRDRVWLPKTTTTLGVGFRYTDAKILQDFFAEPFSRRDITLPEISPNSVILTGEQRPIGQLNLWSPTAVGGANVESELFQYAAFGTLETSWTDRISTIAAVRAEYSDFDIALPSEAERANANPQNAIDVAAESGDTDYVNWSFGANFEIIDGVFLYGTIQEGTSLDPVQGGAIFGEQNFAENEMWEVGVKTSLFEGRLFASLAYYEWEQSQFNQRSGASEALEAEGVEVEATWLVTDRLTLIASYTWQEVRRIDPLGFRTAPMTEQDWALFGGALSSGNYPGAPFAPGIPPANPDLEYPGAPQTVVKLFGIFDLGHGFTISGGPVWQEEFWLSFDRNIELPDALIWNANIEYENEKWKVGLSVENLTDEEYFIGADPTFGANTLVTKAPETTYIFSLKYKF